MNHGMRVLIVDDDFISLELLRNAMEDAGYQVTSAANGREAFELIQSERFRMVVSDWEMPDMSGPELCRQVRQNIEHGYVYLILLTSHGDSEHLVEGMNAGADDFIVKPFRTPELLVRVRAGERILALETRELVIFSMAKLAESRDQETGRHLERVQRYSRILATQLLEHADPNYRIEQNLVQLIYQTSPLHDIGKVGIPDSVLLKPGRLSNDEFEVMKMHTTLGAETLNAALRQNPQARFLQVARDIAQSHHERFDGKGYPQGISGQTIPLAARIVAVADVYDALTSKRVYKGAYTHLAARGIIEKDSGSHFDPEIVKAFLTAEEEFMRVQEQFGEAVVEQELIAV